MNLEQLERDLNEAQECVLTAQAEFAEHTEPGQGGYGFTALQQAASALEVIIRDVRSEVLANPGSRS